MKGFFDSITRSLRQKGFEGSYYTWIYSILREKIVEANVALQYLSVETKIKTAILELVDGDVL